MAQQEQLDMLLRNGVEEWNAWRKANPDIVPDLSQANLYGQDLVEADLHGSYLQRIVLREADLRRSNLSHCDLTGANLLEADLSKAYLEGAILVGADLRGADISNANLNEVDLVAAHLSYANLSQSQLFGTNCLGTVFDHAKLAQAILAESTLAISDLTWADLSQANLMNAKLQKARLTAADLRAANLHGAVLAEAELDQADLRGAQLIGVDFTHAHLVGAKLNDANLRQAHLVETNLEAADLTGCAVYGVSAWNVNLAHAKQLNLDLSRPGQPSITVDNLELAQFMYLLLNNDKIRDVINTIGKRGVLILGRFTERKHVLEAIREELRRRNYVPIVFDFERPTDRDFTETVMILAGLCLFIIADITQPKSVPLELQATVPNYMTPFVPIIQEGEAPFAMFVDLWHKHRDWVLNPLIYDSVSTLIEVFDAAVIEPAKRQHDLLEAKKAEALVTRRAKDYLSAMY